MFVETAVLRSTAPICSAIDMKRLPDHLEAHRVGARTKRGGGRARAAPSSRHDQRGRPRATSAREARVEDERARVLEHERRARDARRRGGARRGRAAAPARGRAPGTRPPPRRHARGCRGAAPSAARAAAPSLGALLHAHARRHHLDRAAARARSRSARGARARRPRAKSPSAGSGTASARLRAGVAQVEAALRRGCALALDALGREAPRARRASSASSSASVAGGRGSARASSAHAARVALPVPAALGEADAVARRAAPRADAAAIVRMPSRRATAQTCCPAAPPKPTSAKSRGSTPRAHRHLLDRLRHARVRDLDEARRDLVERARVAGGGERARERARARARPAPARSGNGKRSGRMRPRNRFTSVSASSRAPRPPVAERARVGARALGPDREPEAVEAAERAAARGHGVDAQHRRAHAHAGHHGLEARGPSRRPPPARRRSRCRPCRSRSRARCRPPRATRAAPTTPPAGPESSAFGPRKRAASVRPPDDCMKRSRAPGSAAASASTWRRSSGVRYASATVVSPRASMPSSRATSDESDDVREARLARELRHALLPARVAVRVDAEDRDRLEALGARGGERGARRRLVEGLERAAVRVAAPGQLERALVERRRLLDREREQLRALLRADREQVAEPARGDEQRAHAAPLEQRVGRDGGAELHAAGRERPPAAPGTRLPQHAADRPRPAPSSEDSSFRVWRRALRIDRDDVRERAAAVDPERPLLQVASQGTAVERLRAGRARGACRRAAGAAGSGPGARTRERDLRGVEVGGRREAEHALGAGLAAREHGGASPFAVALDDHLRAHAAPAARRDGSASFSRTRTRALRPSGARSTATARSRSQIIGSATSASIPARGTCQAGFARSATSCGAMPWSAVTTKSVSVEEPERVEQVEHAADAAVALVERVAEPVARAGRSRGRRHPSARARGTRSRAAAGPRA